MNNKKTIKERKSTYFLAAGVFILFFIFAPCALSASYQASTDGNFKGAFIAFSILSVIFSIVCIASGLIRLFEYND